MPSEFLDLPIILATHLLALRTRHSLPPEWFLPRPDRAEPDSLPGQCNPTRLRLRAKLYGRERQVSTSVSLTIIAHIDDSLHRLQGIAEDDFFVRFPLLLVVRPIH
jgi:hypothetical protein